MKLVTAAVSVAATVLVATQMRPPQDSPTLTPAANVQLRSAPDGTPRGQLAPGAALTPLARERGWVRVRVEGWVRESELVPADSALLRSPSAADLRADPDGMVGRMVSWDMEFVSIQRSDPLRKDMALDESYILARGPGNENALVYLVVPPSLLALAQTIPPLSRINVTARVRNGKSRPVGVPILDIETLSRR